MLNTDCQGYNFNARSTQGDNCELVNDVSSTNLIFDLKDWSLYVQDKKVGVRTGLFSLIYRVGLDNGRSWARILVLLWIKKIILE